MIPHHEDHIPAFDNDALEREWLAQEAAMRRERLQREPTGEDARSRHYRLIAHSLRQPLTESLPADFARHLAARVGAAPAASAAYGASLEIRLTLVLLAALAIAGGVVVAIYGSTWLPSFTALLPTPRPPATGWLLVLCGCLGASWLAGVWQQRSHHRPR